MTPPHPTPPESRREFFRSAMRWVIGTGICTTGTVLARRKPTAGQIQTCINRGVCSQCRVSSHCGLPRALSMRRAQAQHDMRDGRT